MTGRSATAAPVPSASAPDIALAALAVVAASEIVAGFASPTVGTAAAAIALVALLNGAAFSNHARAGLLGALALVPLARVASLTLPFHQLPRTWWHVVIGVPVLAAAIAVDRELHMRRPRVGTRPLRPDLAVALSGLPLGLAGYAILRPRPLGGSPLWLSGIAVVVGGLVGLTEELVYRGMLQPVLIEALGPPGLLAASGVYAAAYLGTGSAAFVAFMTATGLVLGVAVRRSGRLWPAVGAHGLLVAGMIVVWPRLLR